MKRGIRSMNNIEIAKSMLTNFAILLPSQKGVYASFYRAFSVYETNIRAMLESALDFTESYLKATNTRATIELNDHMQLVRNFLKNCNL